MTLDAPAPNAAFVFGEAIRLTATAADSDGIAKVEFFDGTTKLGEDTAAPYEYPWSVLTAGSYSITARAIDAVGRSTGTPAQTLVITPNVEGLWANLNTAQKADLLLRPNGDPLIPNRPVEGGAVDAVEVLRIIGVTVVIPKFSAAMSQAALSQVRPVPAATTADFV